MGASLEEVKNRRESKIYKDTIDNMYELYLKKNSDYGNSFAKVVDELGLVTGLVFLHTKLDRLTNLMKKSSSDEDPNFESIDDTLLDMANYSIMIHIELEKLKQDGLTIQ